MLLVLVRHVSSLKFEFGIRECPIALFVPHKITSAPRAIRSCFSLQAFWVANISGWTKKAKNTIPPLIATLIFPFPTQKMTDMKTTMVKNSVRKIYFLSKC